MKSEESNAGPKTLVGVERTVRILQALERAESANLVDIARGTSLNEATVLRYLNSLVPLGFVERVNGSQYRLGWEVFRLGQRALTGHVPREAVRPPMEALLAEFNETVNLAYRKNDEIVIVEVFEGTRAIKKISEIGQSDPWHASALGKVLMAQMDDEEWQRLLQRTGLPRLTEHTITSRKAMGTEITKIRDQGFAVDNEESDEGLTCVGAVVPTPPGMAQFALSVSFLTHRPPEGGIDYAGGQIRRAAEEIGRKLA